MPAWPREAALGMAISVGGGERGSFRRRRLFAIWSRLSSPFTTWKHELLVVPFGGE
jgi:hypothetical protein